MAATDDEAFSVADLFQGSREDIETINGKISVTIYGDRTKTPCIAYPEVGVNHQTCFQSLFVASGPQSLILKNFYTIFIDPPGCEPNALTDARQRLSMNQMICQIDDVISKFGIKECLGLGVGNGAYMLAKYAAEKPKNAFIGLILISPSCRKSSWWEWATGSIAASRLASFGWSRGVKQHLMHRLFSPATTQYLGGDSDLMKSFRREVQKLDPIAVSHYLKSSLAREDIRPLLKQIKCRVLLIFGAQSIYHGESMEVASHVDKSKFALVEIDRAGVLVNEERPADLLSPFQLFLTALQLEGYGIGSGAIVGE